MKVGKLPEGIIFFLRAEAVPSRKESGQGRSKGQVKKGGGRETPRRK